MAEKSVILSKILCDECFHCLIQFFFKNFPIFHTNSDLQIFDRNNCKVENLKCKTMECLESNFILINEYSFRLSDDEEFSVNFIFEFS